MSSDIHLEIPTFGRPMRLGSLYDCVNDSPVPGPPIINLADHPDVSYRNPHVSQSLSVLSSTTLDQKLAKYGAEDSVRLSYICGLITPGNSGQWINNRPAALSARVTLHYRQFTYLVGLRVKSLKEVLSQYQASECTATHMVAGLSFGVDLFTDFTVTVEDNEEKLDQIRDELESLVQCIKKVIGNECRRSEADEMLNLVEWKDRLTCSLYGDIDPRKDTWNIESCISFYQNVPMLLKISSREVPMFAWLSSLANIFPESFVPRPYCEIDAGMCRALVQKAEDLENLWLEAKKLLRYEASSKLKALTGIDQFLCDLEEHYSEMRFTLRESVLKCRSGESSLESWIRDHSTTLDGILRCKRWVSRKDREEKFLQARLQPMLNLKFVESGNDFDRICTKDGNDFLVCLQFFSGLVRENYSFDADPMDIAETNIWFQDENIVTTFDETLRNFEILQCLCAGKPSVQFVLGINTGDQIPKEAANILIYASKSRVFAQYDPKDFQVQGLEVKTVKKQSIKLTWLPLRNREFVEQLICCWKESKDDRHQSRQEFALDKRHEKISIQGLKPAKEYDLKIVCVDVFGRYHDSVILTNIKTAAPMFSFGMRRGSTLTVDEKCDEFVEIKTYD